MAETANMPNARRLSAKLASFVSGSSVLSSVLREVAEVASQSHWRVVLFGGAIRDVYFDKPDAVRDLDLVVADPPVEALVAAFESYLVRRTRFGGLRLRVSGIDVDMWPLSSTWGFAAGLAGEPRVDRLSATTFLNIEGVAAELETFNGRPTLRVIESGNFLSAVRGRTLEIALSENPFPDLCVVRSIALALDTGFALGPALAQFIDRHSRSSSLSALMSAQLAHYGYSRMTEDVLACALDYVSANCSGGRTVALPDALMALERGRLSACPVPTRNDARGSANRCQAVVAASLPARLSLASQRPEQHDGCTSSVVRRKA